MVPERSGLATVMLGHAAASTPLDIYGHLVPSDNDRICSAVDPAFRNPEDSLRTLETESSRCASVMPDLGASTAEFGLADR
jgi:hypothetical protein